MIIFARVRSEVSFSHLFVSNFCS